MTLSLLDTASVENKAVLLRVDLNVPMKDGIITDDMRLKRIKKTVNYLKEKGAKILLLSHFGRPKGQPCQDASLRQLIAPLETVFGAKVFFLPDLVSPEGEPLIETSEAIAAMEPGSIALFENTRFYAGEEANDPLFAKALATYGAIFVNDAFSASHRAHASVDKITDFLPSYAGLALQKELKALEESLDEAEHPIVAIVGGAKISTKIALLENLVTKVDSLVIAGGMANSILAAQGIRVGKSLCERGVEDIVERIFTKAHDHHCTIILPVDGIVAEQLRENAPHQPYGLESLPKEGMILDLGSHSIDRIKGVIDTSKTLLWNGPLGAFEVSPFDKATTEIARYVAKRVADKKLVAVAGGGDTVAALKKAQTLEKFSYISTGGGAFLEWLEGKTLPGIAALKR